MDNDDPYFWRELALAAFAEFENDDLPDRTCRDVHAGTMMNGN